MRCRCWRTRFLLLCIGGLLLLAPARAQFFSDITDSDPDQMAIENAAINQLMEGYPDGAFHPERSVRRIEGVMIMARLLNISLKGFMVLPPPTAPAAPVAEVPATHWVRPAAQFLADRGMLNRALLTGRPAGASLTRGELLSEVSRLFHTGTAQPPAVAAREFAAKHLLPAGWEQQHAAPVSRRELARLLDSVLYYLTQHAVAEGTIVGFETDDYGERWVRLETAIGEACLLMPKRGVIIQGSAEEQVQEGMRIRTVSDAVSSTQRRPYFRVREVTVIPQPARAGT